MRPEATLTSPLRSTLERACQDPRVRFEYLSHHCGLHLKDVENLTALSKYAHWCEKSLRERGRPVAREDSPRVLYEAARRETIHPNFTKYWGYLNPHSASTLNGKDVYQIYFTRPSLRQFDDLLSLACSVKNVLVKYARLKFLEKRHDTVAVYVVGANAAREIWDAGIAYGEPCGPDSVPGFATASYMNLSLARLKGLPKVESNGQMWQKVLEEVLDGTQSVDRIMEEVSSEFDHLCMMLSLIHI